MANELTWHDVLAEEKQQPYFLNTLQTVASERQSGVTIYPPQKDVFNAFRFTELGDVKVVILGQDPYHGPSQAHGLCFSVKKGVPAFELVQSTVADEYNTGGSGDIHMHPSGNYLYTSHRLKNDGLAVFSIGKEGLLKKIGYVPTKEHPRNFLVTPCGKYIIVASKNEFIIQVFEVGEDGVPVATETVLDFSPDAPVSVVLNH